MASVWGGSWGGAWGDSWGQSWGANVGLSAPSGMRRLQLYELQEEALKQWEKKKDEQVEGQEAKSGEGEVKTPEPVAAAKPRPRRVKRRAHEAKPTAPIIPWRSTSVITTPTALDQLNALPKLFFGAYSVAALQSAVIISLDEERNKRRQRNRRRAAAFLLMAA